jgi:hypothetical protein
VTGLLGVGGVLSLCLLALPLSGWWLAVRLPGDRLVRFTTACLAGVATLGTAEILVYALRWPQWVASFALAGICFSSGRNLMRTFRRSDFEWRALLAWGGTSAILVSATVHYAVHGHTGALWDWYEHWLRSLVFLTRAPVTTPIGFYIMPARGPLFNAAAAMLMSLSRSPHFWAFQVIAIAFNTLILLPFSLMLEAVGGLSRYWALPLAAGVCLLVPFFFFNNTFTWTKSITAAFILMGIYNYLMAFREGDGDRMVRSLLWFAVGFLFHYLALLYGVTLGMHLLYVRRRALPLRELSRLAVICSVFIGPWFGYMFLNFGIKHTLGANTTVSSGYASRDERGRLVPFHRVLIANLCVDLLPRSICRMPPPPVNKCDCQTVEVEGSVARNRLAVYPPATRMNGVYAVLGYSGSILMLTAALATVGLLRRGKIPDARFLLWLLSGGLLLNLLPIRWFDWDGTFGENLHAWCLVLFALAVPGLLRLPRLATIAITLAFFAECFVLDLQMIREQAVVLPLAHHESALGGNLPLGAILPTPVASTQFSARIWYYVNYNYKIKGGAVFFRDLHPDSFRVTSWVFLGVGLLLLAGVFWTRQAPGNVGKPDKSGPVPSSPVPQSGTSGSIQA